MRPRQHRRVPQVNLFARPPRGLVLAVPRRYAEVILVAVVIVVWTTVGFGLAILLGWQPPHLGLGP